MYRNLCFENLEGEVWKDIPNFEGKYQASNLGRIKTLINYRKDKRGWIYKKTPKIMKQVFTTTNYLMVILDKKNYKVHRLIAETFIPKEKDKNIVNHIDFDKTNNKVENLEWCTQKENMEWSAKNDKMNKIYKFDENEIRKDFEAGKSVKQISKEKNVPQCVIKAFLHKNNIKRSKSDLIGKYGVSANIIRNEIKNRKTNKEITTKYNIPQNYVAVLKYKLKKKES